MGKDEIQAAIDKLDAMVHRCDVVIARELPLKADTSPRRWQEPPQNLPSPEDHVHEAWVQEVQQVQQEPIGTGELTGNEMRVPHGGRSKPRKTSATGYRAVVDCDCSPDVDDIWAHFEREFDDMVAGLR